jgi:uncharacterized protein
MSRSSLVRSLFCALAAFAILFVPAMAWAKYVPPPPPQGHVVTTVGWLAPYDVRKINEEAEIAQTQTGYVIDVLLAKSDEPIEEISAETFQAWKPGDPKKDNGLLLVFQPNFPRGKRKVRLQIGKGVEAALPASKANQILREAIGPLLNGGDEVRTAVAAGVFELAKALGADESVGQVANGVVVTDASALSGAAPPMTLAPPVPRQSGEAPPGTLWKLLGAGFVLAAACGGLFWLRNRGGTTG